MRTSSRVCCEMGCFRGYTPDMLEITPALHLDERELQLSFIRSAGPGGQNVNKVATAVQLRFSIPSSSLPDEVKTRLRHLGGKRVTQDGVLIIEARTFRTQEQNREEALRRFVHLVRKAAERPKPRTPTRPTRASQQKRLDQKKRRGDVKRTRQVRWSD